MASWCNGNRSRAQGPSRSRSQALIAAAAVLFGTVTVGGSFFHQSGFSLYEIALYPLILTFLLLVPVLVRGGRYALRREMLPFFAVYGLIGALAELAQFGGIVLGVPVATVSLLLYTQPIWTSLLGKLLLQERITGRKTLAVVLAFAGAVVLIRGELGIGGAVRDVRGIAAATLGGVFVALWVIWGRKSGIHQRHSVTTTLGWSAFSSAWLIVLWPVFFALTRDRALSRLSLSFDVKYWSFFAVFALIAGVLPSLLLFRGLQTVPASTAGILLLLEPVSASLMAALFFRQPLGVHTLAGGFLILLSNFLLAGET
ncbi:MAG TPA: DMT family transporter [Thermoanaerobaculia bacterium]|nr:DMT family transporter [Thermoanaerobaculia bacterium]